jgi:hypothetical protein
MTQTREQILQKQRDYYYKNHDKELAYRKNYQLTHKEQQKEYRKTHPPKYNKSAYMKHRHRSDLSTRAKVIAFRYGKLAGKCEKCPSTEKLEMHHDDYLYPLEVRTLCKDCHEDWHVHNKALHQYDDPHLLDNRHCDTCIKQWPNCERANFHKSVKGKSCAFWTDRPWPKLSMVGDKTTTNEVKA